MEANNQWLHHFSRIEFGGVLDLQLAQGYDTALSLLPAALVEDSPEPLTFFTLADVERSYAKAPASAASVDGIPGALVRAFSGTFAKAYFPVHTKACLRIEEPVAWKGGFSFDIFKGSGDPAVMLNSRSVMATSHMSKRHRALLRKELVQFLPEYAGPTQFGGIKGRGTDMASLTLWTHQAYAAAKGTSSAYIFIDAVSAFYRSLRQLIFYCAHTDASLPHLISSLELGGPAAEAELLQLILQHPPFYRKLGYPSIYPR